ncbi:MAG: hypothetical protein MJZ68_05285, partial [archaeon]|nr:hypothetical protein [archaeon]
CTVVEDWDNPNWTNMALMLNELWFKQLSANHDIIALKTFIEPDKDSWSIFRLAVMYEKGDYVGKDVEMAFALLKDSVELGNKEALKYLTGKFKEKNGSFSARVDEYVASRKK